MSARRRQEDGFSALEIVIIVMVILVLAAISVPNMVAASRSYKVTIAAEALSQLRIVLPPQRRCRRLVQLSVHLGSSPAFVGTEPAHQDQDERDHLHERASALSSRAHGEHGTGVEHHHWSCWRDKL